MNKNILVAVATESGIPSLNSSGEENLFQETFQKFADIVLDHSILPEKTHDQEGEVERSMITRMKRLFSLDIL